MTTSPACLDCTCPQSDHKHGRGSCACGVCKRFRATTPGEPHRTGAARAARRQEQAEAIAARPHLAGPTDPPPPTPIDWYTPTAEEVAEAIGPSVQRLRARLAELTAPPTPKGDPKP